MVLSVDDLLEKARKATGLEDFGDPFFLTGLAHLVASFNVDCPLNDLGRQAAEGMLLENLINRLQIEDWYRRHPEIDDEVIRDPVFIVGLPRTGTTVLGTLLGLDRDSRCLRNWEINQPCPPPDERVRDDPRIAAANRRIAEMNKLVPGLADALPRTVDSNMADECFFLLNMSFASVAFNGIFHVPSYEDWALTEGLPEIDASYGYHKRILKLLQWKTPARRWVLRTPIHSGNMGALIHHYPDARFIWTHRPPEKVLPSICSLIYQVRALYHRSQDPAELGRRQLFQWSTFMRRLIRDRERIGDARFIDVRHGDFIADPEAVIGDLYRWLGWHLDDDFIQQIRAWREGNPRGRHKPDPAFFGLNEQSIDQAFATYRQQFQAWL